MAGEKPLLDIPDGFVQDILQLITGETETVVSIIKTALDEYKKPLCTRQIFIPPFHVMHNQVEAA